MRIITSLLLSLFFFSMQAQEGHRISIEIDAYEQDELYLAYYLADKQYIQDTVQRNDKGLFVFEGEEALPGGMYLVVMAPDNNFFQILVDEDNQRFEVKTKAGIDQMPSTVIKNSKANEDFYAYLRFLADQRPKAEEIQRRIEMATNDADKKAAEAEIEQFNEQVSEHQQNIIKNNPKSLNAAMIKANLPFDIPEFEGTDEEQNTKKWRWMQKHYFDNIDMNDTRLLRTPFLYQRVEYYVNKLQVQHPDTISMAIDQVLSRMKESEDNFKFYLIHFLNHYAASKYVGMDAVYVHLVDNYYAKGMAPWTEEEQLKKITDNANKLRPLLIGKTAPNILMQRKDESKIALHDVESPYTVLYFWRYDCGHCKKSTPHLKAFYDAFHDQGVEIFAACAKLRDEVPECWDYIEENKIGEWIHVIDPYGRSRFMQTYDLKTTPQIFVLDKDKKIISKRLGAEQLAEFFNNLLDTDIKVAPVEDDGHEHHEGDGHDHSHDH